MNDIIKAQIKIHELYAQYWMAMATTGLGTKKDLSHGTFRNNIPLTNEEKIEDCLATSLRHIRLIQEIIDYQEERG